VPKDFVPRCLFSLPSMPCVLVPFRWWAMAAVDADKEALHGRICRDFFGLSSCRHNLLLDSLPFAVCSNLLFFSVGLFSLVMIFYSSASNTDWLHFREEHDSCWLTSFWSSFVPEPYARLAAPFSACL
jgi:hypothetical protein